MHLASIYQQWYSEHQLKSYSLSDISWIGSVQIFLNFAGGLVGGPVLDRYGNIVSSGTPRKPLIVLVGGLYLPFCNSGHTPCVHRLCGLLGSHELLQRILSVLPCAGDLGWYLSRFDVQHFACYSWSLLPCASGPGSGYCDGWCSAWGRRFSCSAQQNVERDRTWFWM